jgi:hypothetical protein
LVAGGSALDAAPAYADPVPGPIVKPLPPELFQVYGSNAEMRPGGDVRAGLPRAGGPVLRPRPHQHPPAGRHHLAAAAVPGILEPLDRDTLVRRSVDIFPQGYLINISIIQGVALAAIVSESTKFLRDAPTHLFVPALAQSLLNLAGLIVVSYEYLWWVFEAKRA